MIATPALASYLAATRLRDVDLPVGRSAVKRLRAELEIAWNWDEWWSEREADLCTMTLEAFAMRHGCSVGAASQRRTAFGRR